MINSNKVKNKYLAQPLKFLGKGARKKKQISTNINGDQGVC